MAFDSYTGKHHEFDEILFAESIIKECIRLCVYAGMDVTHGGRRLPPEFYEKAEDDLGEVAVLCATRIKEHFGME